VSRIVRIAVPLRTPEDVIPHLGKAYHWKQGRSAKSLADCWFHANAVPPAVAAVLAQSADLTGAELLDGWLERQTDLGDGRGTHSQTDLFALLGQDDGLIALGIEAKVDESFGPLVSDWLADGSSGKRKRLEGLCTLLGVASASVMGLRYQLLHRTAAVLLEAKRFRTSKAALVIQSFCPKATGLADARVFFETLRLYGLARDGLAGPVTIQGVEFWVGWAADTPLPA
jgi:hypothetical protein